MRRTRPYKMCAQAALGEVTDAASPKILELGCGRGGLSRNLLENHPAAQVTVTDIDPTFVAAVAASDLGSHPRATVREMDATAIDAPDGYYDLAVFALSLHHLAPERAARVFAEGTRAANKLLIIDLRRWRSPVHVVVLAANLPFTGLVPLVHDGVISSLRAYSPSALRALAQYADPAITVEFAPDRWARRRWLPVAPGKPAIRVGNVNRDPVNLRVSRCPAGATRTTGSASIGHAGLS